MTRYLLPLLVASTIGAWQGRDAKQTTRPEDKPHIIVHMKHYTDDIHSAYMALELAERLQSLGSQVTLLLDLEGARFADGSPSLVDIRGPGKRSFADTFEAFKRSGGRGLVCHHCAEHSGIDQARLRKGVDSATIDEIAKAVMSAEKIIEY
ncbi:MAG: DsrE family protein [Phycisphaerae bacterium]|nr:DsrE family protein [Phycisphaerae bacterium]